MSVNNIAGFRHVKSVNQYNISNCYFSGNSITAYSYNWWVFVKVINGLLVFNNYNYSATTNAHQRKTRRLLDTLGYSIDLTIEAPKGLQDIRSSVTHYERLIFKLQSEIANPRSKRAKNVERANLICKYRATIETIESHLLVDGGTELT